MKNGRQFHAENSQTVRRRNPVKV